MVYEGLSEERHVIIPSSSTSVVLVCAIQPGALASKYTFEWEQLTGPSASIGLSQNTSNISVNVSAGETATKYRCRVTIRHVGAIDKTYNGPDITVNSRGKFSVHQHIPPTDCFLLLLLHLMLIFTLSLQCCQLWPRVTSTTHR